MNKIKIFIATFVIAVTYVLAPLQVSAADTSFYSSNDILFYNPDAMECQPGSTINNSSVKLEKSETLEKIFSYLISKPLSSNGSKPLNGVQAAGVMGNMYAESGFNPASIEVTTRAEKGHGLVQWTFGRWHNLEAFASQKGTSWDNLDTQLQFLSSELEGPEKAIVKDSTFSTTSSPGDAAKRFRVVFERAQEELAHDDKRITAAQTVYEFYKDLAPAISTTGTTLSSSCVSDTGIVANDIVKTAIGLALPAPAAEGTIKETDARDTYRAAKMKYNPTVDWTDCGGFIATVMIASGVDKDYVKVNVAAQLEYVKSHPEKYEINEKPTLNDLMPGDILFTPGHTTMYTGESKYPSVDASLNGRVPSVRGAESATIMISEGAVSARVIK